MYTFLILVVDYILRFAVLYVTLSLILGSFCESNYKVEDDLNSDIMFHS